MKIAIYVDNRNIKDVDCSDLMKGNPGIGGTEYCALILAQALKLYSPKTTVYLFAEENEKLPSVDKVIFTQGLSEIAKAATQVDILVISSRRNGELLTKEFFDSLNTKTIVWGHNYYYSDFCDLLADSSSVKANVFVGRQQYDRYIDHKIIEKSTYIYNMYPSEYKRRRDKSGSHQVTYIGSLIPSKGFQVLAKAWKDILKEVPDAELNVIGSGKLYSRDAVLGKYGIADAVFENQFIPYLTDSNGDLLPSVHFLGVLGTEKDDVIQKTGVGVVNPTGRTETFGISALDFESMGIPVVTIAKGGFLDTVIDGKTGILIHYANKLDKAVIRLLQDNEINEKLGNNGAIYAKQFSPELIVKRWNELFTVVSQNKKIKYHKPSNFMFSNMKSLRSLNHDIKKTFHIRDGFSVIQLETFAKYTLNKIRK